MLSQPYLLWANLQVVCNPKLRVGGLLPLLLSMYLGVSIDFCSTSCRITIQRHSQQWNLADKEKPLKSKRQMESGQWLVLALCEKGRSFQVQDHTQSPVLGQDSPSLVTKKIEVTSKSQETK